MSVRRRHLLGEHLAHLAGRLLRVVTDRPARLAAGWRSCPPRHDWWPLHEITDPDDPGRP